MKKQQTEMKAFLLNHKGIKYKADTFLGIIWQFITKKK
jgi:hypothetical protein